MLITLKITYVIVYNKRDKYVLLFNAYEILYILLKILYLQVDGHIIITHEHYRNART